MNVPAEPPARGPRPGDPLHPGDPLRPGDPDPPGDGDDPEAARTSPHPAALHDGPAHIIRWANPAFLAVFGAELGGLPAREAMTGLPRGAFALMDRVLCEGQPLAIRVTTLVGDRRLVVVPRKDIETGETYGVTTHLRVPEASR